MKKTLLSTLVLVFATAIAFAQFPGESFKQVTGEVKKIKIEKPAKGTLSQIVVIDDNGKEMVLAIDPEATCYDAEFYPVTLEAIKVKNRVNIRYDVGGEGTNLATWFNILE